MTTEDIAKSLDDFGRQIRAAGRILWRGDDPNAFLNFVDSLNAAVFRGYEQAWREGALACSILPQDRTPEEQAILAEYLSVAQSRIMPLGDFIQAHNRAAGGKWTPGLPSRAKSAGVPGVQSPGWSAILSCLYRATPLTRLQQK